MKSKRLIELLTKELFQVSVYNESLMFFKLTKKEEKEMKDLFIELSKSNEITEETKDIIDEWYNVRGT